MIAEGFATVGDGCRIAWRIDGDEDAPLLTLSNSLGTTMDMWALQVPSFIRSHRVLRYDTRGHGRSSVPPGAYALDRLGRDVVELLDALGVETTAFCGLSLGGMTGQWLGVHAPQRLTRLVIANSASSMGPPSAWQQRIQTVLGTGMSAIADAVLDRWFTPEFRAAHPEAVTGVRDGLIATDPVGYAGCCAAIRDMDLTPLLPLIAVPTLVIAGDRDPATPAAQTCAIAAGISGARSAMLDAAHLSNLECPDAFSEMVGSFLGRT